MNVKQYLATKAARRAETLSFGRNLCVHCLQPDFTCYCATLEPFDPGIQFVILIHPREFRRRIATGRLSHLCLNNSHLINGEDYTHSRKLNPILQDPRNHCMILYPGAPTVNLSPLSVEERRNLVPADKQLTLIVIDGTWATARKMLRLSQNLRALPRICFTPRAPSNFRIRRQPRAECVSTIEAIHEVIELFDKAPHEHHRLLEAFDRMVDRRLELAHSTTAKYRPNAFLSLNRSSNQTSNNETR